MSEVVWELVRMLRQKFDHDNENVFWYILKQVWYKDCLQFLQFLLIVVSNKRASLLITFEKKIYPTKGPLILILGWLLSFWGLMNVHVLQEQKVSKCSLDPGIFHSWCHCLNNYATQPWILWGVKTQLLICKNWNFMSYQKLRCCHKTKIRGSIDESYFRKARIWRPTYLYMFLLF